jgi:flavin reductase (DIM6/NTAB) family NADH-FMN oxidoreductase RutF
MSSPAAIEFRHVLGHFASGIVIITGCHESEPVGLTCQSFFSVSIEPPLVAIAVAKTSVSWPRIMRGGAFCINILSHEQLHICHAFAVSGERKFDGVNWHQGPGGLPRIDRALAWIDCRIDKAVEAGDHEIVIGSVENLTAGGGSPLLFFRGEFGQLTAGATA